jgi:hypothetical protein
MKNDRPTRKDSDAQYEGSPSPYFRDLLDFDRSSSNNFSRMNLPTFEELLNMIEIEISKRNSDEVFLNVRASGD